MSATLHIERERDGAKSRLDAMDKAEGDCQAIVEKAMADLAKAVGASDRDLRLAYDAMYDTLSDLTYDARQAVEREISACDDRIGNAEWEELERSSPVVL